MPEPLLTPIVAEPSTRAWGSGLTTIAEDGTVLDAWFPQPVLGSIPTGHDRWLAPAWLEELAVPDKRRGVHIDFITCEIDLQNSPVSTPDAYLRLHLLSHRIVRPNSISLAGLYAQLVTVAWTNAGPMLPATYEERRPALQRAGIHAVAVDKFPRLTDYLLPPAVRIADTSRVRLGAHLSPGTTVMHEGFVGINAGTLGASMIEGRLSEGVVVGNGSDVGGGASVMATHSGGSRPVLIGERSLLGANSGIGISLGDNCVVEAGLYVTAGTKVVLADEPQRADGSRRTVKAAELSGVSDILFRRNSLSGQIEVLSRTPRHEASPSLPA